LAPGARTIGTSAAMTAPAALTLVTAEAYVTRELGGGSFLCLV